MPNLSPPPGEFYIGFAPVAPRKLSVFRRRVVCLLALMALGVAVSIVLAQQPFVANLFEFLEYRKFQGIVEEQPYPALLIERPGIADGGVAFSRYFLTIPGKRSAVAETSGLNGREVRAEGALIYLDGDTMVELKEGTVELASTAPTRGPTSRTSLGEISLTGEVIDSKCYLGVMNPAKGKVHKACAIRCISGGVPPGLLVRDEAGGSSVLILVGRDGRPLNNEVVDIIGEPVRVTGELMKSGDTRFLYANPDEFQRIDN